jgi:tetratricopeptide (TPR) repeat protein
MSKKRKKKKQDIDPYEVLAGRVKVTSHELIGLIHRVNPTKEGLEDKKASERYKIKARLQSLLIRRFCDRLLVEQPDPENPQLVSLKLSYFDENACHALLPELDPDARSWVQRQIDEAGEPPAVGLHQQSFGSPAAPGKVHGNDIAAVKEKYSQHELMDLGRKALAEYDYDSCEDYFYRAFIMSRGGIETARGILEFFVDHLAAYEKAAALAESLSPSAKKDEEVKILLALAAIRLGNIDQALDSLGSILQPRAAEVYLLAAKHFVTRGNVDRAKELHTVLKSFELNELQPEIIHLEKDIEKLYLKSLEPAEQEMLLAWQQGKREKAVKLAEQLLEQWPQNKDARRICNEFARQQRIDRLNLLLRQADEAHSKAEFIKEAELLKKAIELDKNDDELNERFKRTQQAAKLQQDEAEIAKTIEPWTAGNKKEALLRFVTLPGNQRLEIMNRNRDPHFSWLSQVISTQASLKPGKMVEAVLALGEAEEILQKGGDPRPVTAALQLHARVLRPVPAARDILQRAQEMSKAIESAEVKELLKKASSLVAGEDFQTARECIDRLKIDQLDEDNRKILVDIDTRLKRFETIQAMKKKYSGEVARGNHLSSRDIALELAGLVEPGTALHWREEAAFHSAQIKKEWSLVTGNIEDLQPCYSSSDLVKASEDPNACLLPDGRHILFVSNHDRWVFLRIFCIKEQEFKQAVMFRAPAVMSYPAIYPAGNEIWITGSKGYVISLTLEPLDILSWHDFSEFVKEGNLVEDVCVFPRSGYLWLTTREKGLSMDEVCEVINIEQRRVERRFKVKSHPIIINTGRGFRAAVQDYYSGSIQMISEQGKTIDTFSLATKGPVNAAALHPNGRDYVFLPFEDPGDAGCFQELAPGYQDEENHDFLLTIEKAPDGEGTGQPFIIDDSHGELIHFIYTAMEDGLIFIYFCDGGIEEKHYYLAAFTPSENGFEKLYQVESPVNLILTADELSRKAAAINIENGGCQAVILGRDRPVFASHIVDPGFELSLPSFDHIMTCYTPTGEMNARKLAFMMQIKECPVRDFGDLILQMKQPNDNDPDEIVAFINALKHLLFIDLAEDMKTWFQENYPDHPMSLIESATRAVQEGKWRKVVTLLEKVSLAGLDDGTACHICHLLGLGLFAEGHIERALAAWKKGAAYERGYCNLAPYITYARTALQSPKKRKKANAKNDIPGTLNFFEMVDARLLNQEWFEVISLMEKYNALSSNDLQVLARFAEAFLHQHAVPGELRWLCKVITLATYCQMHRDQYMTINHVLPPYIETWSESRLHDTASRAAQWLDIQ